MSGSSTGLDTNRKFSSQGRRPFIGGSDARIIMARMNRPSSASGARSAGRPNRRTSQATSLSNLGSRPKPLIGNGTSATPAKL
jgi:hypothetical protein